MTLNTAWPVHRPRAEVLRAVEDLGLRARLDLDRRLLGLEPPRQAGMGVGVEADADLPGDGAGRALGAQRRSAEAGQLRRRCGRASAMTADERRPCGDDRQP